MEELDVGVIGSGYVGLVTGACLAHVGHRVTCVDKNARLVSELAEGLTPFYEPGLESLVQRSAHRGRLLFSTELGPVVRNADVVFIAVDTPQSEDGSADLSSVGAVARSIGRALAEASSGEAILDGTPSRVARSDEAPLKTARLEAPPGEHSSERTGERPLVVVNKSTVPVGSGDYVSMLVRDGMEEAGGGQGAEFRVVSNPEFLREGSAIYDSLFPDRIVVGADSREAADILRALYEPIVEQSFPTELDPRPKVAVPFVTTDLTSAEMIKYAANAFLATKVSFINEIANLCELVGADVGSVSHGIGLDGRIGSRFLSAGIGWGGSCFPKDVSALRAVAREYDHRTPLLEATVEVNERQRKRVISKLQGELHTLKGKRVTLLGLSFKPNTDDLREAPSLQIARTLHALGTKVVGYDPVAAKKAAKLVADMKVAFDPYEALQGAHAAVLVTEWEELRGLDLGRAASLMAEPKVLVDGRNALDPGVARAAGLLYRGFGRG